jgi:hypothetical protein
MYTFLEEKRNLWVHENSVEFWIQNWLKVSIPEDVVCRGTSEVLQS